MAIVILLFVICGFLYGIKYFRFYEPYGTKDSSVILGIYILSLKWWNIEFNWHTYLNRWQIDIKAKFIVGLKPTRKREYILIFNSTGVKFCTLDIN